jgi:hypothetical protein
VTFRDTGPGEVVVRPYASRVNVIFAFAFDSRDGAEAARSRLVAEGNNVELEPQEDGSVVLVVAPPKADSMPELAQARLESIVEPFGGEGLGYGGFDSYGLG